MKNIILLPVYNDWKSLNLLLKKINLKFTKAKYLEILIINDCSTKQPNIKRKSLKKIKKIKILTLKKRLGSQKAISIGLDYLKKKENKFYLTIMDSDGEDNPDQLNKMFTLAKKHKKFVITSHRKKRNEKVLIQLGYKFHLIISLFFTWNWITFGNFSAFYSKNLDKIKLNQVWFAYSAAILKNLKIKKIYAVREKRYFDNSKVNLIKLIEHSLRIISVFYDRVAFTCLMLIIIYFSNNSNLNQNLNIIFIFTIFVINTLLIFIKIKNKALLPINYKKFIKKIKIYK